MVAQTRLNVTSHYIVWIVHHAAVPIILQFSPTFIHITHSAQKVLRNACADLYLSFYHRTIALAIIAEYLTLTSTEMEEYTDNHTEIFYFVR